MPLFESIEGDVAAFFVSQGSVFDALTRSLMERTARVESRVDALTASSAASFQSVNQLVHTVSTTMDANLAAAALAQMPQHSAATEGVSLNISNSTSSTSNTTEGSAAVSSHMDTHELEYYIMTLSRQLHVVLELFFQPHAHDIAHGIQAKQAQFETISDVLTQNEAILMQLSAVDHAHVSIPIEGEQQQELAEHEPKGEQNSHIVQEIDPILETHDDEEGNDGGDDEQQDEKTDAQVTLSDELETTQQNQVDDEPSEAKAGDPVSDMQVEFGPVAVENLEEPLSLEATPSSEEVQDDRNPIEFSPSVFHELLSDTQNREARVREQTNREGRRRIGKPTTTTVTTTTASSRQRKKSLYDSFRDFHTQQLTDEERQRLKDQEMMRKMQQLLQAARKQWQQEVAASTALTWQRKLHELETQQLKLQREWQYLQQQQTPNDLVLLQQQQQLQELQEQQQKEFDRQFAAFSSTFLTSQQAQEQQIARILDSLRDFQDQFVQKADFDSMASAWLQTVRDECIFGVNVDALTVFKQELEAFQTQLGNQELSPLTERLLDEANSVLELLNKVLGLLGSGSDGLHGPEGFQVMQTLRTFLTMLDDSAQNLESDKEPSAKSSAFISDTLRQMELGTAYLLEAFESQQDRYQHAFEQHQLAITQLQRELWNQKQADQELKSQLAGCPSQEDTLRFIQELRDQVRVYLTYHVDEFVEVSS